ncbi:RidA family protein [Serratia sp. AKBS12]|uniref:RidA family protein n=1 Tax=Serratia sp. AKBS12 TaxID=2974597 RepID=UPI0021657C2E|nr:RidA family protein [Serratia sp. AKBS12]MCS3408831.1 RidA family protein [Serratia sp. AKBS12]
MSGIKRNNYSALPTPGGPYVHAVRHRDVMYVSGLTAFATAAQGQSAEIQAQTILEQLAAIAAAEGGDLTSVLKLSVFLTDIADLPALRPILFNSFDGALPAYSLMAVSALFSPEVKVEIEAILAL